MRPRLFLVPLVAILAWREEPRPHRQDQAERGREAVW